MKRHELVNLAVFITLAGVLLFRVGSLWPEVPDEGAVWRRVVLGICAAVIIPGSGWVSQNFQRPSAGFLGRIYLVFALVSVVINGVGGRIFEMIVGLIWIPVFFSVIFLLGIHRWIDSVTHSPARRDVTARRVARYPQSSHGATAARLPSHLRRHEWVNIILGVGLSITAAFMTITRWLEIDDPEGVSLAAQWQSWVLAACIIVITVVATWSASNYWRPTADYVTIVYGILGAIAVVGYLVTERYFNALTIAIATPLLLILLRLPAVRTFLDDILGTSPDRGDSRTTTQGPNTRETGQTHTK